MVAVTKRERAALAQVQVDADEAHRAHWWGILSRQDKTRALMVAGLDKSRAADPLATFSTEERQLISLALSAHRTKMDLVAMCMGVAAQPSGLFRSDLH